MCFVGVGQGGITLRMGIYRAVITVGTVVAVV